MSLTALDLCKLLLDEQRIKLLGLLSVEPRSYDELLALSGLKVGVLARHLYQLQETGLVGVESQEGVDRYQINWAHLRRWKQQIFAAPEESEREQSPEEELIGRYVTDGVLRTLPAHQERVKILLHWLAESFHPGVDYPEKAVNEILGGHRVDHATLRRYLVDYGLLEREGGHYRRCESGP